MTLIGLFGLSLLTDEESSDDESSDEESSDNTPGENNAAIDFIK